MRLSLVVLSPGKSQGKTIVVPRLPFVIGRDCSCNLRPSSELVSSRHCALVFHGGQVCVQDLGSTNGTLVDGQPVREEHVLRGGERIQLGPLTFGVEIERLPAVDQPTPLPATQLLAEVSDDEAGSMLLELARDDNRPIPVLERDRSDESDASSPADPPTQTQVSESKTKPQPSTPRPGTADTAAAAQAILRQFRHPSRK
jgi:pSer/pThr/pTyr-binding forkhead associated (FHA) protein